MFSGVVFLSWAVRDREAQSGRFVGGGGGVAGGWRHLWSIGSLRVNRGSISGCLECLSALSKMRSLVSPKLTELCCPSQTPNSQSCAVPLKLQTHRAVLSLPNSQSCAVPPKLQTHRAVLSLPNSKLTELCCPSQTPNSQSCAVPPKLQTHRAVLSLPNSKQRPLDDGITYKCDWIFSIN
ncbi:hypothetical protein JZ751_012812 [Albula glossodonta]|uniref:Uncharacterized protein n=1 Tax=Albula glossodonta TaxID=121402 RepID=A0A8T2MT92_9TELE|nr:hypothetical protein JZ751_012812 [Albula glossodonta]